MSMPKSECCFWNFMLLYQVCLYFQLYIGNGTLQKNETYSVIIMGLINRQQTTAYINNVQVQVNYLVTVDEAFNISSLNGDLYIGGYRDVSLLKVGHGTSPYILL